MHLPSSFPRLTVCQGWSGVFECHKFDIALKDDSLELLLMRAFVFFMDPQLLFIQAKRNV